MVINTRKAHGHTAVNTAARPAHSTQHTAHSTQHTAHSTHIVHTSHKGTSPVDSRSGVVRKLELRKTMGLKKWAMSATEDHSLGRVESGE